jgi:KaiC/GvpD/RAD55 family RecA-like ATPase
MQKFGWDLGKHEGNLIIKRLDLFDITRSIEALLAKQSGDLLIDVSPVIIPEDFKPDMVVIDSLTAIASAFTEMKGAYRIYIEQLFRYFERMGVNTFLISETEEDPTVYSPTGVEEFLADGVIVLYNIRKGNVRENGIEVLKMRGAKHKKKIVAMQITDKKGIEVYPEQEVFSI